MKRNMRNTIGLLGIAIMATPFMGAAAISAVPFRSSTGFEQAMPVTPAQKEIDRLLKQISSNAAIASRHADRLDSFTRVGSRLHYVSHSSQLTGVKEAINAMGADFRRLQELRPSALPWQEALIDRMEPVLVGMAGHATDAIVLLNDGRYKYPSEDYRNAIVNLNAYSSEARTLVAVNLDYAQAREKLNRLDAAPGELMAKTSPEPGVEVLPVKAAATLEKQVRSELLKLPYYGVFDHLAYRVNGDEVTLMGDVSWPTLKTDAERAVRGIEGVSAVRSEIKVLPLSSHDNRIRLATYTAVYGQPTMARYRLNPHPPIRIIVENGHVTLKGVVGNEMDRNIAHSQASGVPGTFSVTNHLQIES